jgi:ribonuclease BN (tRNA processing enzyme)
MKWILVLNGIDHAFLREYGCHCKRCLEKRKSINTSVSLIGLSENDETLYHILFDVGMGVVDTLVNSPYLSGTKARLDWLILSHWHPDHLLDLNRLCETWKRTLARINKEWHPILTWCRNGTAEWIKKNHSFEWNCFLIPQLSNESNPGGVKLDPIPLKINDLIITPITVSHCTADINPQNPKERLECSASFVIEHKGGKKAVLLWDIDNKNEWIEKRTSEDQKKAVELLSGADYLFIDCNTWSVEETKGRNTGHVSFMTVKRYARSLSPKGTTLLIHLSGHEDGEGNSGWGWLDFKWEEEAQKIWEAETISGKVKVPMIEEVFEI